METIFTYNPTKEELESIGFNSLNMSITHGIHDTMDPITKELYLDRITEEGAIFDLAELFELRGDQKKANEYWEMIPEKAREYKLGFDYRPTPVNKGT